MPEVDVGPFLLLLLPGLLIVAFVTIAVSITIVVYIHRRRIRHRKTHTY